MTLMKRMKHTPRAIVTVLLATVCFSVLSMVTWTVFLPPNTDESMPYRGPATRPSFGGKPFKRVQGRCSSITDIPDLKMNRSVNLDVISMEDVETLLLGKSKDALSLTVREGNVLIKERRQPIRPGARVGNYSLPGPVLEMLSPIRSYIGGYVYSPGGYWRPADCTARWKVAIVVPYRNRSFHLPILLRYLTPMLQKQRLEYGVYTVNQANDLLFNRAMLMNVGFLETLNFTNWDCFIFHDVDYIPLSELNSYGCDSMPKSLVSGVDKWNFSLPYPGFSGGVVGMTTDNVRHINGFPNVYWGWGGEDDEIYKRITKRRLPFSRTKGLVGMYRVILHHHTSASISQRAYSLVQRYIQRFKHDGLNNLEYPRPHVSLHMLYTNISVDVREVQPRYDDS